MTKIDETHDPARQSWVESANGHPDFPIQNLPLGVFSVGNGEPRIGVAIGDMILDLKALSGAGLLDDHWKPGARPELAQRLVRAWPEGQRRCCGSDCPTCCPTRRTATPLKQHLVRQASAEMHLPCAIGDYTDFYVGIHHATNVGKQFRPDNPLLPNYKYVPIGYHGRASSVRVSGQPVVRPKGQRKPPEADAPEYGPSRRLDYELELGIFIGRGNHLGHAIPIGEAANHIAGYCLLNDWSARDLQAWEYQPLGPFLAKNFLTSISAWVVTPEALAPFRKPVLPRPEGDPAPLAYLLDEADQQGGALGIQLEVTLSTAKMREAGPAAACFEQGRGGCGDVLVCGADRDPPCLQRLQPPARAT